jgi:hypothetical protein
VTDRLIGKHIDRHRDRHTDSQTDRQTDACREKFSKIKVLSNKWAAVCSSTMKNFQAHSSGRSNKLARQDMSTQHKLKPMWGWDGMGRVGGHLERLCMQRLLSPSVETRSPRPCGATGSLGG